MWSPDTIRAQPDFIQFELFIQLSQPKQSVADSKIGFRKHFSPESHFLSLQNPDNQAPMRSLVVPADKLVERIKNARCFLYSQKTNQAFCLSYGALLLQR